MRFIRLQIYRLSLQTVSSAWSCLIKTRAFRVILYTCTLHSGYWWQLYCDLWQRNDLSCISIKCVLSWKNKHKRSLKVFSGFYKSVILSNIQVTLIFFNGVLASCAWGCNIPAILNVCIFRWNVCNSYFKQCQLFVLYG